MQEDKKRFSDEIKTSLADTKITTKADPLVEQKVKDAESDRDLKEKYAKDFVRILVVQLVIMNCVFVLSGFKILEFEKWTLDLYMGGTLAEVFGIVLVITKNLFPTKEHNNS
jgi:hypothetical protein